MWPEAEVATENRDAFVDAETGTGDEVPGGEGELYMDSRATLGGCDPIILQVKMLMSAPSRGSPMHAAN